MHKQRVLKNSLKPLLSKHVSELWGIYIDYVLRRPPPYHFVEYPLLWAIISPCIKLKILLLNIMSIIYWTHAAGISPTLELYLLSWRGLVILLIRELDSDWFHLSRDMRRCMKTFPCLGSLANSGQTMQALDHKMS